MWNYKKHLDAYLSVAKIPLVDKFRGDVNTGMMEPWRLTAIEARSKIQAGELTIEDYAKSILERIKQRDDAVKAWAYLNPEYVLEQARTLDAVPKEKRGPLHGIPVAIKDVMYTKGEHSC